MGWGRFILAVVVCILAALAAVWSYFETNEEIKNPKPPPGIVETVTDIFFTKPQEVDWRKYSDEPPSYAAVWGCAFVSLLAGAFAIVAGAYLFD